MRGAQKTALARQLRRDTTDAERALWRVLRDREAMAGHKFRRQHPVGPYIADFVCLQTRLIIEADGGQYQQSGHDAGRDAFLRREGFRILRFWNNDILQNLEGVCDLILRQLSESTR